LEIEMKTELLQQALDALIESRDDVNTCLYQHKPFAGRARYDMRIAFYEAQLVKHDAAIEGLKQTLAQQERSYPVAEYEDGQWWVKELESLFVAPIGSGVTADQKRAADIALNFMRTVWAQQEQPASVDTYVGAREDAAIWKKRALEAEELNRKFIAELNGPTYLGEPAQQEQPSKTERQIRRMFCVTYASDSSPYMDDGEAQDNSRHPCIDFLRDSPEQIQSKMVERAIAKHKAQQEQPVLSDEQIAEIAKPFISSIGNH
jgi:hypothetical protein